MREGSFSSQATLPAFLFPLPPQVDLGSVYRGMAPGQNVYRLRSMVCYYGAHYFAFVLLPELGAWVQVRGCGGVCLVGGWVGGWMCVEGGVMRVSASVCRASQALPPAQLLAWVPRPGLAWSALLQIDDTRATNVGDWAAVQSKCVAGRVQPSLLLFEKI